MRARFRLRFSVLTLMIVIALLAVGLTWLHSLPVTANEALRIAADLFQKPPGAEAWKGCLTRVALSTTGNWWVDFIDPATGHPFVQIKVNNLGKPGKALIPCQGEERPSLFQRHCRGYHLPGLEIAGLTSRAQ